jgi:predicted transcriptional regulator of viral defense system
MHGIKVPVFVGLQYHVDASGIRSADLRACTATVALTRYIRSMERDVRVRPAVAVAEAAAEQWGLITTAQAERIGVSRARLSRLAEAGSINRIRFRVYAVPAAATEYQGLRAAWLSLDPARTAAERLSDPRSPIVVSHASAALVYGFGDLPADRHEFTSGTRRQTRQSDIVMHVRALPAADYRNVDGLPMTTVERLIPDLLDEGHGPDHVAAALAAAVAARRVDLDDLPARLAPYAKRLGVDGRDGSAALDLLLDLGGATRAAADELRAVAIRPDGTPRRGAEDAIALLDPDFVSRLAGMAPPINPAVLSQLANIASKLDPAALEAMQSLAQLDTTALRDFAAGWVPQKSRDIERLLRDVERYRKSAGR